MADAGVRLRRTWQCGGERRDGMTTAEAGARPWRTWRRKHCGAIVTARELRREIGGAAAVSERAAALSAAAAKMADMAKFP